MAIGGYPFNFHQNLPKVSHVIESFLYPTQILRTPLIRHRILVITLVVGSAAIAGTGGYFLGHSRPDSPRIRPPLLCKGQLVSSANRERTEAVRAIVLILKVSFNILGFRDIALGPLRRGLLRSYND